MKLTQAQKQAVSLMKEGLFLWANEKTNVKAWIGDDNGKKITDIPFQTAESLFRKERIQFENGDFKSGIFKYELVSI